MRLVFYPTFHDERELSDHFYRLHWFLFPFRDLIDEVTLLHSASCTVSLQPPQYLDQSLSRLVGQLNVHLAVAHDHRALERALDDADVVLVWRSPQAASVSAQSRYKNDLAGKRVIKIDHHNERHAGSFYLKFAEEFPLLLEQETQRSRQLFSEILQKCASEIGHVFGTGPCLAHAKSYDFSTGISIACNSMVRNRELMERLKPPLIAIADPIFHAGCSSYAAEFRKSLVDALDEFGAHLVVPLRDAHIYRTHLPDHFQDRIVALPFVKAEEPNLNLVSNLGVTTTGNILTLFLLPLAATFFAETRVFGCDGRRLEDNSYFWSHDKASQFNDQMADIQTAHPAFFQIDYNDYYLTHCETLEKWLQCMERLGKVVRNYTPSYIPALLKRSIPGLGTPDQAMSVRSDASSRVSKSIVVSLDPEVGSHKGHYAPLNDRSAGAARELGMEFRTFGNQRTEALAELKSHVIPYFSKNSWDIRKRDFGEEGASYSVFVQELRSIREGLKREISEGAAIFVFMYCGSMSAAEALYHIFGEDESVHLRVNLFWCSFFDYRDNSFRNRWQRFASEFLRSGRNRFFGTTERLADGLKDVIGVPVEPLPHVSPTYSDEMLRAMLMVPVADKGRPANIAFPATPRPEKGVEERDGIVKAIAEDRELQSIPLLLRGDVGALSASGLKVAEIVKGLTTESHPAPNGPSSRFSNSELITLERVLLPFMDMYDRRSVDRIHWPAGVFYRVDKPDVSVDSRFELTGRARYLAYGPYMHLPTGTWEAELYVEVGDNWSGNVLTVDLEMAGSSRNGKYALPQSGAFRLGFDVEIEDPRAAIEVRLGLAQGAIEGWMELIGFQRQRGSEKRATGPSPTLSGNGHRKSHCAFLSSALQICRWPPK